MTALMTSRPARCRVRAGMAARVLLLPLVLAAGSPASAISLLTNPGFETGDFTGWTVGGNPLQSGVEEDGEQFTFATGFSPGIVDVRSGSYAAYGVVAIGVLGVTPKSITLSQTVDVTPGADYEVGFFLGHGEGTNLTSSNEVFIDGTPLGDPSLSPVVLGGTFVEATSTFSAGAASQVDILFEISASGIHALVSLDDFYVRPVPEPGAAVLWCTALVALGVCARRRTH